jgi:hypothetical protein
MIFGAPRLIYSWTGHCLYSLLYRILLLVQGVLGYLRA